MKPAINDTFTLDFSFTEQQVLQYAELSGDSNPIHVDGSYGRASTFGRCIVHGYFSISIFSRAYGTLIYPDGHILISQSAKYMKPIFTDTEYVAVFTVKELYLTRIEYVLAMKFWINRPEK